ncbi:hypothetical protein BV20DRAFT_655347 [Pilatotrama ljubarskyi]|nr:hypothetical protein BV20DRAFT_655347 [Pilatotrama ljubarskyi]
MLGLGLSSAADGTCERVTVSTGTRQGEESKTRDPVRVVSTFSLRTQSCCTPWLASLAQPDLRAQRTPDQQQLLLPRISTLRGTERCSGQTHPRPEAPAPVWIPNLEAATCNRSGEGLYETPRRHSDLPTLRPGCARMDRRDRTVRIPVPGSVLRGLLGMHGIGATPGANARLNASTLVFGLGPVARSPMLCPFLASLT